VRLPWDGSTYLFELVAVSVSTSWIENLHHAPDGRLVQARTKDGAGYDITYKSWTSQEISESPSRQWQMDSVTDTRGRTLAFEYDSVQHAGNWVITKITLPDSNEIEYRYANGFLSEIEYPDSAISTFSFSQSTGGMVRMHFNDLKAEPRHRKKTVVFAGSASVSGNNVVPTAVGMVRLVKNGEDEITYFNFALPSEHLGLGTPFGGEPYFEAVIYTGGGKLHPELHYSAGTGFAHEGYADAPKRFFADGWHVDLTLLEDTYEEGIDESVFSGALETSYVQYAGRLHHILRGTPDGIIDERGVERRFQYTASQVHVAEVRKRTRTNYPDDTFETFCYNARNQVTRYRDRFLSKNSAERLSREIAGSEVQEPADFGLRCVRLTRQRRWIRPKFGCVAQQRTPTVR
jgi:hypothetical protein